jgi:hypothetical protein
MDSPATPRRLPRDTSFEARLEALLEIKRDMLALHARLEYLQLMLKLGVHLR